MDLRRDAETGIETLRAFFRGHAYDLHSHDEFLIGFTEQGVQQFRCRRQVVCSTPGRVILMEPGEPHDGESPDPEGFTYGMLYLPEPGGPRRAGAEEGRRPGGEGPQAARLIRGPWRRGLRLGRRPLGKAVADPSAYSAAIAVVSLARLRST